MQLNQTTDYAVRIVLHFALNNRKLNLTEIAHPLHIPELNCRNTLGKLKTAGIVDTSLGVHGGYFLQKKPEDISLRSIYDAMHETIQINRCLEAEHYCSGNLTRDCPVHKFYAELQDYMDHAFSITIGELMNK